ncbi:MAG: TetR/AcrR family transcriptional regulator [bacterium]|nr:TetR/AcrR family transcriptional regulator [bacterium]
MASNTKENILNAAIEVFAEKGMHGSRMEEIAARAGANKAMVYYYYSSRENLYDEVLRTILFQVFNTISDLIDKIKNDVEDPEERIRGISKSYSNALRENQNWFRIMLEALTGKTDHVSRIIRELMDTVGVLPLKFKEIFEGGVKSGKFREIDFGHFINAFLGLHLSFYVIRPVFATFMDLDEKKQEDFLKQRETIVPELLLYGIIRQGETK